MVITGGTQVASIAMSIARMKVLAVVLGPAGVGLLSVYQNLQQSVATAAELGMGSSGVRELATTKEDPKSLAKVRYALFVGLAGQGVVAMVLVWLLRTPLAVFLFGTAEHERDVGIVGIGVLLSLILSSQTALLRGLRLIGDLGRVTVLGAFAGSVVGLAIILLHGKDGLIWYLVAQPLCSVLVATYFARRLPVSAAIDHRIHAFQQAWKPLARLGFVFMLGGLATTATLLAVRSMLTRQLGLHAVGEFSAAWGITMTYVGFLLQAMGADYYPRLAEVIHDRFAAAKLINDQTQLGVAIGGPILLGLVGLAPWATTLLYSSDFTEAARVLQWQTVGNIFKLACWPLGLTFVAAAQGRLFLLVQLNFNALYFVMVWGGLPFMGLEVGGAAFLAAYVLHFVTLNVLVRRVHAFRWERRSVVLIATHGCLGFIVLGLAYVSATAAAIAGVACGVVTTIYGLRVVLSKIGTEGRFTRRVANAYEAVGWPVKGGTMQE